MKLVLTTLWEFHSACAFAMPVLTDTATIAGHNRFVVAGPFPPVTPRSNQNIGARISLSDLMLVAVCFLFLFTASAFM
ncbi:MAG: hypothetical protein AB8B84_14265 [Granulosicoccus sp.]